MDFGGDACNARLGWELCCRDIGCFRADMPVLSRGSCLRCEDLTEGNDVDRERDRASVW